MSPWNIIGWAIIAVVCVVLLLVTGALLHRWLHGWVSHLLTRHTPPAKGQQWCFDAGADSYWIDGVEADGTIRLCHATSVGTWTTYYTPQQWRALVRRRRGFLVS